MRMVDTLLTRRALDCMSFLISPRYVGPTAQEPLERVLRDRIPSADKSIHSSVDKYLLSTYCMPRDVCCSGNKARKETWLHPF